MAVLGYLPELKRDLELSFGADFLHDIPIKMFFIRQSFNAIPFPSQEIKQNVLLSSYLDS